LQVRASSNLHNIYKKNPEQKADYTTKRMGSVQDKSVACCCSLFCMKKLFFAARGKGREGKGG
jgi:hypothetical protein